MNLDNIWFQNDGAINHQVSTLEKFPERVISKFSDVNWPPRSYEFDTGTSTGKFVLMWKIFSLANIWVTTSIGFIGRPNNLKPRG